MHNSNIKASAVTPCRICNYPLLPFMDFGQMPISNGFLRPEQFSNEYFYRMEVAICEKCGTFQLTNIPAREHLYHQNYAYFASTSRHMERHFAEMSSQLTCRFLNGNAHPFVVEVGCNDGILLRHFLKFGISHLGVEPSASVASAARAQGLDVLTDFFSFDIARRIVVERGHADLCIATNTMHNIENTNGVAAGIAHLLKPDGVFVQEDPYLGRVIENVCYDQIYAEHMYIWSLASLENVYASHGLEVFDAEEVDVHGGCMRYFISHTGARRRTARLRAQKAKEVKLRLDHPDTYARFRRRCEDSRTRLRGLLKELKNDGYRIVGYGATAKSTTVINYCGLGAHEIEFICDNTPMKQGQYSPGAHIPIEPPAVFSANYPDFAILFAWNHLPEIEAKEAAFRERGGKWIIPVGVIDVW